MTSLEPVLPNGIMTGGFSSQKRSGIPLKEVLIVVVGGGGGGGAKKSRHLQNRPRPL
jgi:hypothetical protein